jgi:RNA polymerase sigma factor (sigma-70 family)
MSSFSPREVVVSEYAQTLIRVKAWQLCRHPGFSPSDENDFKQELALLLLAKLAQFDPTRATLNTFIDRVVESGVRMLLRAARRLKRGGGRRVASLDVPLPVDDDEEQTLGDTVSYDTHSRRTGSRISDPRDQFVDRGAIEQALEWMSEDLRQLARRLMETTPTELAADLGISRQRMREPISTMRRHFVRAGFNATRKSRTPPSESA